MIKYFAFLNLLFFIVSCNSSKIFYDYGDIIISWQVDNYFDLTSEQEEWIEGKIMSHLDWHQKKELPDYKIFLVDIQEMAKNGISMKDLDIGFSNFETKRDNLFNRLIPDIAFFLTNLSSDQIDFFEEKILKENLEIQEELDNKQDLLNKKKEKFFEQMENWFGELSEYQISQLSKWQNQWYKDSFYTSKDRIKFRLESQKQFLSILRSYPKKEEMEDWLRKWTLRWVSSSNPKRKKRILINKTRIIKVDKILTNEQRFHALKEIDYWIKVIDETIENY